MVVGKQGANYPCSVIFDKWHKVLHSEDRIVREMELLVRNHSFMFGEKKKKL